MKRLLFMMFCITLFAACQSEYDKMSEYEKSIYDVGTNCPISVEDIMKSAPVWKCVKIISSTEPEGKGDVQIIDFTEVSDGGFKYNLNSVQNLSIGNIAM